MFFCHNHKYGTNVFFMAQGRTAVAAKEAVLAAELFNNAGDVGNTALALFTLGSQLLRCAEVRQAVEVLESSLLRRRRARDTLGLAESLCLLGQAFGRIGYQLHAMDYFDQALALCHELGNRPGEAICLRHLGLVHHLHGDHHEALSALDRSLTLCLRRDDTNGQALCHEHISGVHLDLGDARLALQHLEEVLYLFIYLHIIYCVCVCVCVGGGGGVCVGGRKAGTPAPKRPNSQKKTIFSDFT
jgi:tetratricopeptide (TPR) repeat protein